MPHGGGYRRGFFDVSGTPPSPPFSSHDRRNRPTMVSRRRVAAAVLLYWRRTTTVIMSARASTGRPYCRSIYRRPVTERAARETVSDTGAAD